MDNEFQQKIIALLEKISSNQDLQIQRQLESLEIQRTQFEKASEIQDRAELIQDRAEKIQKVGRNLLYILLPVIAILFLSMLFKWLK